MSQTQRQGLIYRLFMAKQHQGFHLRPAQVEDVEAVAQIWHLGWRDGHLGHVDDELVAVRTADSFATRTPTRLADTTVALANGEIAGFVMVVDDEVEQVYVAADFRGVGVADVLLDQAERQVSNAGFNQTWLAVVAGNARARSFYERRGWTDDGAIDYQAGTADGKTVVVATRKYVKNVAT